jgi:hypothetical protein
LWSQPFLGPTCFWAISCRPCGFPHVVCILPELEAVEEHDVKINGTLVVVGWPYLCHGTHLHIKNPNFTLITTDRPRHFRNKKLWMQKTIRSVDATVRIVDGSVDLLKNRCTTTIWGKEIPITRGYEYDLRDCRRVGLITRCETAAQLRAAEIRFGR